MRNINTEYIKALINWAIDCWNSFPKKSDYIEESDENDEIEEIDENGTTDSNASNFSRINKNSLFAEAK